MFKIAYIFIFLGAAIHSFGFHSHSKNQTKNSIPASEVLDFSVVISLDRHMFRFEETKSQMEKAGFTNITRFSAVDGFHAPHGVFESLTIQGGGPGQKGCTASHLIIWREFFEDPTSHEYLFVCEDDMLPHSNFRELFPFYWSQTPENFDLVMVGNQLGELKTNRQKHNQYLVSIPTFTTHAYIISKKGAKKLYNQYMNQKSGSNFDIIDIFLIHAMGEKRITFYCYDGRYFPDPINHVHGKAWEGRDSGLCFQNFGLGTSIHSEELIYGN